MAPAIPGISKNKWKSKIFNEIGASRINAKAIHFLDKRRIAIKTSRTPTTGKTYPVAASELMNSEAFSGNCGIGKNDSG